MIHILIIFKLSCRLHHRFLTRRIILTPGIWVCGHALLHGYIIIIIYWIHSLLFAAAFCWVGFLSLFFFLISFLSLDHPCLLITSHWIMPKDFPDWTAERFVFVLPPLFSCPYILTYHTNCVNFGYVQSCTRLLICVFSKCWSIQFFSVLSLHW